MRKMKDLMPSGSRAQELDVALSASKPAKIRRN